MNISASGKPSGHDSKDPKKKTQPAPGKLNREVIKEPTKPSKMPFKAKQLSSSDSLIMNILNDKVEEEAQMRKNASKDLKKYRK